MTEIVPDIKSPFERQVYLWRIRLRLWRRNLSDFFSELRKHHIAMLGGIVIIMYLLAAVFAEQITVYDPTRGDLRQRLEPPAWYAEGTWAHPLGTDGQGRDMLTRVIYGARISLAVGIISVAISVIIGMLLGTVAGYYRGRFDYLVSRFADILLAFPFLIFAFGVMAFLGPGFTNLILALTFKGWVEFFRLVRGEMLSEKTQEYVEAAKVTGHSHTAIATLRMGYMIIMEASLSFLGLGIPPHIPAWGSMVASGRDYLLFAPWVSTIPGIAIVGLVLSINLFGEGLRDILDPRLKIE
jgi:peptide/nickel transport system permease protein